MYQCDKCKADMMLTNEFSYHLKDKIWMQANKKRKGVLCLKCIQLNLGRKLQADDFQDKTDWLKAKQKGLLK